VRLDVHLDTDPGGAGGRARWWAVVLAFAVVILAEAVVLTVLVAAVLGR
jgi:hypothetical protein